MAEESGRTAGQEAGSTLAAGGAALGGDAAAQAGAGAAGQDGQGGQGGESWFAGLPAEHHEALKGFKNGNEAVLGLLGQVSKGTEGMVKIPGQDASAEEVAKFRQALGVPDKPEGYVMPKAPEGVDLDDAVGASFKEAALGLGLTPQQFEGLLAWAMPFGIKNQETELAEFKTFSANEVAELRKTHGAETAKVLDAAKEAALALGGEGLIEALGRAGSDHRVLAAFAKLAPLVAEGKIKYEAPAGGAGEVTKASIVKMMADPRYADPDTRDPAYVAQVEEACKKLSGQR